MSGRCRKSRYQRGIWAERMAAFYLSLKGYRILTQRYKTPVGEIDLIARRGASLVFVEVKHRRTHAIAAESIHARNQQRVVRAAQFYLATHPQHPTCTIRFDALLITWYGVPVHRVHAFDASSMT